MARVTGPEVGVGHGERKLVDESPPEILVYKRRWLMLFLWVLSNILQGFMSNIMSSPVVILSKYYQVSQIWVEWTATVWSVSSIIFTIPSAWVLNAYGLKFIIVLCGAAGTVGSILLLFSIGRQGFPLAFVGITIASAGSAFTNSVPPRLANVWFSASEVSTANCIGILANIVGCGMGFLIPSFLLVPEEGTEGVKKGLEVLNWSTMLLNAAVVLATILWYQEKPPIAPSKSVVLQEEKTHLEDYGNLVEDSRALYKNTGFLFLVLSCTINQGVGTSLLTILDVMILSYFPEGQQDVGVLGMVSNIIGVPALMMSGRILDKTKKFQEMILWNMILNGASAIAFLLCLHFRSMTGIYCAITAFGFFNSAVAGLAVEMAVELSYPISEGTSVGWLAIILAIGTVLINFCGFYSIKSIGVMGCLSLFVVLLFTGAALAWTLPKNYLRLKANDEGNSKDPAGAKQRQTVRF